MRRANPYIRRLLILAVCMAFAILSVCGVAAAQTQGTDYPEVSCGIYEINQYGNVILNIYAHELDENGYEAGDIVRVTIGEERFQMPYGTGYSDVNPGYMLLMSRKDSLVLCINQQSFAAAVGLPEADVDVTVTISMDKSRVMSGSMRRVI